MFGASRVAALLALLALFAVPGCTALQQIAALRTVAFAVAGQGMVQKDMHLDLVPTIETSIGPIRYPLPVTVHRATISR